MKYLLMMSLLMMAGCATTDRNYSDNLDRNKTWCPSETVQLCEGPHRKMMTCKCVKRNQITIEGLGIF